jgi:hypothetical protein
MHELDWKQMFIPFLPIYFIVIFVKRTIKAVLWKMQQEHP